MPPTQEPEIEVASALPGTYRDATPNRFADFVARHPRRANVLLFLASLFFCVLLAEIVLGFVNARLANNLVHEWGVLNQPDPLYGFKPKPNASGVDRGWLNGVMLYEARYTTNEFGRRVTPITDPESRNQFITFFGCSYTFGLCLQDNESIPAYVGEFAPDYMPYNFAYLGWGPQQTLLLMDEPIENEVKQTQGIGLYIFIPHQVRRVIGSPDIIDQWAIGFPYYYLDGEKLVRDGTLGEAYKWRLSAHRLLRQSQTLQFLRLDRWPLKTDDDDFRLTARIIAEARTKFQEKWPDSAFYCVIYPPIRAGRERIGNGVKKYLDEYEVPVIEAKSPEIDRLIETDSLYIAAHPTAAANQAVARLLVDALSLRE